MPGAPDSWRISMFKTTKEFIRAIGQWWWVVTIDWMVGAVVGTAQSFGRLSSLPAWTPYVVAFIGFIFACFVAFHRLRVERDDLSKKLENNLPKFKGHIEQIIVGELKSPDGAIAIAPHLFVKMSITNRGAPSIAQNFLVVMQTSDGQLIQGQPFWNAS